MGAVSCYCYGACIMLCDIIRYSVFVEIHQGCGVVALPRFSQAFLQAILYKFHRNSSQIVIHSQIYLLMCVNLPFKLFKLAHDHHPHWSNSSMVF